jgi:CO/xanthine dehydrogenase Mo-binding subunit
MISTNSKTILSEENKSIQKEYQVVGTSYPKIDAIEKVCGTIKYAGDIYLPNMLYGKLLRSKYAHAKIISINTKKAESFPGVKAVITSKDIPDIIYGMYQNDQRAFAKDKVVYQGDIIAAVAAEDKDIAEEAIKLIEVEYGKLPVILDPGNAIMENTPQIHDGYPNNIAAKRVIRKGNVEEAFKKADYIFEDTFYTQMVDHAPIETHVAVASVDSSGMITIWSSTQAPFNNRLLLSKILQKPLNKIRIIGMTVGGAFGGKQELMAEPTAVFLSLKTNRPVKIELDRADELTASSVRHPFKMTYKTALSKEGKILARKIRLIQDSGAYNDLGEGVLRYASIMAAGPYKIDNVWVDAYLVYTNKNFGGVMRGVGVPQVCFAGESQIDMIANKLGIDPFEIRIINALQDGDTTANSQQVFGIGFKETLEAAKEKSDYINYISKRKRKNRGIGIASMMYSCSGAGRHDYNSAIVKFNEDGTIVVLTGTPDVGQGSRTVLAQIAAEELGMRYEDVWTSMADTAYSPVDMYGANATRITYMAGNAVRNAAREAKKQLIDYLFEKISASEDTIKLENGKVFVNNREVAEIKEIVREMHRPNGKTIIGIGSHNTLCVPMDPKTGLSNTVDIFLFATGVAEVEVDPTTGKITVLNMWSAHDVGKAINPINVEGQIEGGTGQALGFALCEEIIHDQEGNVMNPGFLDYKIFTALDMPKIHPIIVEVPEPKGPFGARGIGECTTIPGAASIANAVYNAVRSRVDHLPMTPEYIYRELKKLEEGKK